jgi:hypothetical protein
VEEIYDWSYRCSDALRMVDPHVRALYLSRIRSKLMQVSCAPVVEQVDMSQHGGFGEPGGPTGVLDVDRLLRL